MQTPTLIKDYPMPLDLMQGTTSTVFGLCSIRKVRSHGIVSCDNDVMILEILRFLGSLRTVVNFAPDRTWLEVSVQLCKPSSLVFNQGIYLHFYLVFPVRENCWSSLAINNYGIETKYSTTISATCLKGEQQLRSAGSTLRAYR